MGGLLKKFSKKENDIKIVFLATGISSRRSNDYLNSTKYKNNNNLKNDIEKQIEKLQKDARKALSVLGIKKIQFEDFPDNEMDTVSNLKITKK